MPEISNIVISDVRYILLIVLSSYFHSRIGDATYRFSYRSDSPFRLLENGIVLIRQQ
jgi:hypothetical protein